MKYIITVTLSAHSNSGYGVTGVAMRDGLIVEHGQPNNAIHVVKVMADFVINN